jgi:hypothetical protein
MTSRKAALRTHLVAEHDRGRSYRTIAKEDYGGQVSFGIISNIILYGKFPTGERFLVVLGLNGQPRRERSQTEEAIIAMSMMTRQGLRWKKRRKK